MLGGCQAAVEHDPGIRIVGHVREQRLHERVGLRGLPGRGGQVGAFLPLIDLMPERHVAQTHGINRPGQLDDVGVAVAGDHHLADLAALTVGRGQRSDVCAHVCQLLHALDHEHLVGGIGDHVGDVGIPMESAVVVEVGVQDEKQRTFLVGQGEVGGQRDQRRLFEPVQITDIALELSLHRREVHRLVVHLEKRVDLAGRLQQRLAGRDIGEELVDHAGAHQARQGIAPVVALAQHGVADALGERRLELEQGRTDGRGLADIVDGVDLRGGYQLGGRDGVGLELLLDRCRHPGGGQVGHLHAAAGGEHPLRPLDLRAAPFQQRPQLGPCRVRHRRVGGRPARLVLPVGLVAGVCVELAQGHRPDFGLGVVA